MRVTRRTSVVLALVAALVACKDKNKPQEREPAAALAGLAAVPANVTAVVSADIVALGKSELVRRLVSEVVARDPALAKRVGSVIEECKLEPGTSIKLAIAANGAAPGESLLVLVGAFEEAALVACVGRNLSESGGFLTQEPSAGRTIYKAAGGPGGRTVHFALASDSTLVIASTPELLGLSLSTTEKKLKDNVRLSALRERVIAGAPLWAIGLIPAAVGERLVGRAGIEKPPQALVLSLAVKDGIALALDAEMATSEEAKLFVSLGKAQVQGAALVAQKVGLGEVVNRVDVEHDGAWVRARLELPKAEVEEILRRVQRMVDRPQPDPQNPASDGPDKAPRDKE